MDRLNWIANLWIKNVLLNIRINRYKLSFCGITLHFFQFLVNHGPSALNVIKYTDDRVKGVCLENTKVRLYAFTQIAITWMQNCIKLFMPTVIITAIINKGDTLI